MRLDLEDLVDVQLPVFRDIPELDPEEWSQPDWRRKLVSWMFGQARRKAQEGRPYEEWDESWKQIGPNGLPGDLTWEEFVAASSQHRHSQNIAGTRPLQLLTWSGDAWLLPRAYTELLDRWEQREGELLTKARLCSCGAQGPYWGAWRRNTRTGYVTMCPPCSVVACRPYTGHMRGVLYESPRRRNTRADDYLCRLCNENPAAAWDHCHDHGYLRGPLCGSCNTREGKASPDWFLQDAGSVLHLLECRDCREQRTLPRRFHTGVVLAHLEQTERHPRCRRKPYARELEYVHGVHRFELDCGWHTTGRWTKDVTVAEAAAHVRAFVDASLALQEGATTAASRLESGKA
ncbi:endonuclease domain-containing protein [Streptomyces sp. NPDC006540]|uniref:endonuclease domain-containing protein n=1 Tax=Streptomyces sp. NPDC006540 TaxID=3155353 RepID=UPI0033A1ACE0